MKHFQGTWTTAFELKPVSRTFNFRYYAQSGEHLDMSLPSSLSVRKADVLVERFPFYLILTKPLNAT